MKHEIPMCLCLCDCTSNSSRMAPGILAIGNMMASINKTSHGYHGTNTQCHMVCMTDCTCSQMARGILAIGGMMAASINKTGVALGGALNNYASNAMNRSPPLSEPLTLSKSYVSR